MKMAHFGTVESAKSRRKALLQHTNCLVLCLLLPASLRAAGPPPEIVVQPSSQTVLKGSSAVFFVSALSVTTMWYQWRFNGQKISGATQSTYTVGQAENSGTYSVEVINASGSVLSSNATLQVLVPPQSSNDSYTNLENHVLTVPAPGILANDIELNGLGLTALLTTSVSHGVLNFHSDGSFSYTPNTNYYGSDSFTYVATDGLFTSGAATVNIKVVQVIQAALSLTSAAMTTNGFKLRLSGPAPASYIISASSDLTQWTPIATNSVLSGKLEFTDTTALRTPIRFYRAVAQKNW
jgi:hypothetical protein